MDVWCLTDIFLEHVTLYKPTSEMSLPRTRNGLTTVLGLKKALYVYMRYFVLYGAYLPMEILASVVKLRRVIGCNASATGPDV